MTSPFALTYKSVADVPFAANVESIVLINSTGRINYPCPTNTVVRKNRKVVTRPKPSVT